MGKRQHPCFYLPNLYTFSGNIPNWASLHLNHKQRNEPQFCCPEQNLRQVSWIVNSFLPANHEPTVLIKSTHLTLKSQHSVHTLCLLQSIWLCPYKGINRRVFAQKKHCVNCEVSCELVHLTCMISRFKARNHAKLILRYTKRNVITLHWLPATQHALWSSSFAGFITLNVYVLQLSGYLLLRAMPWPDAQTSKRASEAAFKLGAAKNEYIYVVFVN